MSALTSLLTQTLTGPADDQETLTERALGNEGQPIPSGTAVRVSLIDAHGTTVEYQDLTGDSSVEDLIEWVGGYVMCMAAEAMPGSVKWEVVA